VHRVNANVAMGEGVCVAADQTHDAVFGGEVAESPWIFHAELGAQPVSPAIGVVITMAPPSPCSSRAGRAASMVW
jgi:hypothetical protein